MKKKSNKISERQKEILKYIISKVEKLGYPPTVREIAEEISLKSSATIHAHLKKLEELGFIRRNPLKPRAIEVNYSLLRSYASNEFQNDPGMEFSYGAHGREENSADNSNIVMVPVLGQIAAGSPILATENIEDFFPLTSDFLKSNEQVFILRVKGDSMINAGIFDKDYAVIKKQDTAMNGEIIAALIEDEATIKRFFKKEKSIKLMPENDHMKPIEVKTLKVLGRVIGIIRKYF
jgi:repressor LexA